MVLENSCSNPTTPTASTCIEKSKASCSSNIKFDCLDCEVFRRKLKENAQTVSSRDVLIEMLQGEIQKIQNLYKGSIDDYEKLRFIHCSTVHDYSSLKEIYRKIEAENRRLLEEKKSLLTQLDTLENLHKQLGLFKNELVPRNEQKIATDDFAHIENIMQIQNQSLKLLLSNFLEDLKNSKFEDHVDAQAEKDSIIDIKNLQDEVEKLRMENQKIRESLNAKQEHLSKCLDVLEKNHIDIGNLSTHIENICCERDNCMKALDDKDREISKLKNELSNQPDTEDLKVEKERYRQENIKLKKIIVAYKSDNETKNSIIEKYDDEREQQGKSEELQTPTEDRETLLDELRRTNEALLQDKNRYLEEIKELENANNRNKIESLSDLHESHDFLLGEIDRLSEEAKKLKYQMANSDVARLEQINEQLQQELDEMEERHNKCKCDLEDKVCQLELTNTNLRDTLAIVTTENRSNLDAKDELNNDLKKVRSDLEECENRVSSYKKDIEDRKAQVPGSCSQYSQYESTELTDKGSQVEEKGEDSSKTGKSTGNEFQNGLEAGKSPRSSRIPTSKNPKYAKHSCSLAYSPNSKLAPGPSAVEESRSRSASLPPTREANIEETTRLLQNDLDQAILEIAEYEEENKFYRQKLEALVKDMTGSEEEKSKLRKSYQECIERQNKMRQEFSDSATEKDDTIKKLNREIDRLARNKPEISDYVAVAEKTRLQEENAMLNAKLNELEQALTEATNQTQEKVLVLENKIDALEKQDREKQKRLESCCDEMDKIQMSLNADENVGDDILNLKDINRAQAKEIDALKNAIEEYETLVNKCDCMNPEVGCKVQQLEKINEELEGKINYLEEELGDKRSMIVKIEKCLDNSNQVLGDSEEELKLIHSENERLRKDLEVLQNKLDEQTNETETHKTEKNSLEGVISRTRRKSEELERENSRLLNKNRDQKLIEGKISKLQAEYNKLLQESKEKDSELEKLTRQFEVLQGYYKQPSISRQEFLNLKKVSQEIKTLVTDQSKNIVSKASSVDGENSVKQDEVTCLQCKNEELSEEVGDLKRVVKKVISDNNNLKLAITNLLNTVMDKIKFLTDSGDNLQSSTTEDSVKKIQNSVSKDTGPSISTSSKCNCMDVIKSRYSLPGDDPILSQCASIEFKDTRKIETILDVRMNQSNKPSGSRKSVSSCDLCCGGTAVSCCKGVEKPEKTHSDEDCLECTGACAFNRVDEYLSENQRK